MQTTYSAAPAVARVGQRAFVHTDDTIVSRILSAATRAGRFVCRDANDQKAKVPVLSADVTSTGMGVVLYDAAKEPRGSTPFSLTGIEFAAGDAAPVMTKGFAWVTCETAAAFGGTVYVRFTTATDGSDLGAFRNDTDSGKAVALPGARFDMTISAGGLVRVEFGR